MAVVNQPKAIILTHLDENFCPETAGAEPVFVFELDFPHMAQASALYAQE